MISVNSDEFTITSHDLPCLVQWYTQCFVLTTVCHPFVRFEGSAILTQQRGKPLLVHVVVMTDLVFFVHENNQKYYFVSPDNKVRCCLQLSSISLMGIVFHWSNNKYL